MDRVRRPTQRGERANRGPSTTCGRTRVARIAGCRLEQKVGYGRHTDQTIPNTTQSDVFGVLWHLKKQGYSEHTINFVRKALKVLEDGCGLQEPETRALVLTTGWIFKILRSIMSFTKEKYWVRMLTPDWGGVSSQNRVVSLWIPLRH